MRQGFLGTAAVVALLLSLVAIVATSRLRPKLKAMTVAALTLRVLGTLAMIAIIFGFYDGIADANKYLRVGGEYAYRMSGGDFSMWLDPAEWAGGRWWGSHFLYLVTGVLIVLLGPTLPGTFLLFSLLAFLGLVWFGRAFSVTYPHVDRMLYLRWIWFFPSLWLWPAVVGKEALVLLGLGITTAAFARGREGIHWPFLALGFALIFAVRPQIAAVVALCLVLAQWFAGDQRWTLYRVLQGVAVVVLGIWMISRVMLTLGAEEIALGTVGEYLEYRGSIKDYRGSYVEVAEVGLAGIPIAIGNILFRPLPWEAANVMALGSALEIWGLWILVWFRRRNAWASLRSWRADRLIAFSLFFTLIYTISLGMVAYNLGIIARQRIFLFPFLFVLLEAVPQKKAAPRRESRGRLPAPRAARLPPSGLAGGGAGAHS